MKLKGIWVAIAVICVAGIGITDYSARHLAAGEPQYASENIAEKSVSGQADMAPVETETREKEISGADGSPRKEAGSEETAYAISEQSVTADAAEVPALGSPEVSAQAGLPDEAEEAAGGAGSAQEQEETLQTAKNGILAQLAELDAQTEARRSSSADGNANAMKAAAESERKAWESKMQSILEILEQQLSGEEKNAFFAEQRSWVRERESTAVANSKKQNGSALEELEYIRSLRDLTRERVYALAEQYETVLDKTE